MLRAIATLMQRSQGAPPTTAPASGVDITVNPSADGMPGAALIQQLLGWAQMVALWASVAAMLAGAAMYGLAREGGSYGGASRGKTLALGGVVGAIIAGLAPAAVSMLFEAARS